MARFLYEFEWDPVKAKANFSKHGVDFERATLALTIPGEDHSDNEIRWITLGKDMMGLYVLVVHTFEELANEVGRVRVISVRRPTRAEVRTYEER